MAGDGTQRANVERLAQKIGVLDRIAFLGAADDEKLIDLYAGTPCPTPMREASCRDDRGFLRASR